jgi:hypothetical protein
MHWGLPSVSLVLAASSACAGSIGSRDRDLEYANGTRMKRCYTVHDIYKTLLGSEQTFINHTLLMNFLLSLHGLTIELKA